MRDLRDTFVVANQGKTNFEIFMESVTDESACDIEIPKVSIQALADNSITHGMSGSHASIRISIKIKLGSDSLMITVRDNGCGIPAARLSQITEKFGDEALNSGENIGLVNLYSRLKLIYADKADMTIETDTGKNSFTEITITLPKTGRDM